MTTPVAPPLLNLGDLAQFQASDPNWFLNAAGEVVRNFCQWHIAPSITVTDTVPIQPDGSIMLPSLYVTGVSFLAINGLEIDPTTYQVYEAGYITRVPPGYQGTLTTFADGLVQSSLSTIRSDQPFHEYPSAVARHADVTYTHGYPQLPIQVKTVGLELATRAMEMPSGIATNLTAGAYSIGLGELGMVLSDEERRRLGPYTLIRF